MTPDIEFIRGLRERPLLMAANAKVNQSKKNEEGEFEAANMYAGTGAACEIIAEQLTDYLKTKGIE